MLKETGLLMIMAAGTGIGYTAGSELSMREKNLRCFLDLVMCLKGEIRYGNCSLAEAFERVSTKIQKPFDRLALQFSTELRSVDGDTLKTLLCGKHAPEIRKMHFTAEEEEMIFALGNRTGYTDRETLLSQLELYEEELKRHIDEIHERIPEKKKIYRSLGIMGGFLLVILLW